MQIWTNILAKCHGTGLVFVENHMCGSYLVFPASG